MINQECEEIQKNEWYTSLQVALCEDKNKENIDFEEIFKNHAKELMSQYALENNDNEIFLFKEIEYYFYEKDRHPDPYVHKNDKQKKTGCYYFHASGLDITFGNDDFYGGILIRGIQCMNEEETSIFGPIKSVAKMLELGDCKEYNKDCYSKLIDCTNMKIKVCRLDEKRQPKQVFTSTRVGLSPSPYDFKFFMENEEKIIPFIFRQYRFLCSESNGDYREKLKVNFYNQVHCKKDDKKTEKTKC